MSHRLTTTTKSSSSVSESSTAGTGEGGGGGKGTGLVQRHHNLHHLEHFNNSKNIGNCPSNLTHSTSSSSFLVAASGNLVLENEKILKLFPKCRPRSHTESLNQFYASIKDQHQPQEDPSAISSSSIASGKAVHASSSATKKILTDSKMTANSMNLNSNSSSTASAASGVSDFDYMMYAPANRKEKASATNPFLSHHSAIPIGEAHQAEQSHAVDRKLTHSQSDFGVCFSGQQQQQLHALSSSNTDMISKNFQRHMKNPLNYQSNPFIGAAQKIDEFDEELNIIVQDQQTSAPEYYFDRRPVRPSNLDQGSLVANQRSQHTSTIRSTPVGNLMHSPDLQSYNSSSKKSDFLGYQRDHQKHYLNVGCSPVSTSNSVEHQIQAERMRESCSPNRTQTVASDERSEKRPDPDKSHDSTAGSNATLSSKKRTKSVAVVSEDEVVIFDDIDIEDSSSWYNLRGKSDAMGEGHVYKQNFIADPVYVSPEHCLSEAEANNQASPTPTERAPNGSSVAGMVIGK